MNLDLSNVDACDAAALQLLCAARKTAAQLQKPFRVVSLSAAVLEACTALGIPLEELAAEEGPGAI